MMPALTQENIIDLVLDIGILDEKNDNHWNNRLKEFIVFCEENNRRPARENDKEKSLGIWVNDLMYKPLNKCRFQKLKIFNFNKRKGMIVNFEKSIG